MASSTSTSGKKAQAWYLDFLAAFLIFTFTVIIFFTQTNNFQSNEKGSLNQLISDGHSVSSSLLTPGYPADWNSSNAIRIGIIDNNMLNTTKLNRLQGMDYTLSRIKFGITNEYLVFFTDGNNPVMNINGTCGAGNPSIITNPVGGVCAPISILAKTDLSRNERYIGYNASIIRMVVYTWK